MNALFSAVSAVSAVSTVFAVGAALASAACFAQPFPSKPVRMIVPAPPGSAPDFLARLLSSRLTEAWSQPIVIDNVVGAGGNIGTDRVAKAAPDGATLLLNTIGPIGVNISMYDKLPFDPVKDLAPITLVAKLPNIMVVHPSVPAKNVLELIAYAKQNPGKLRYGSPGSGTSNHLSAELFKMMGGIDLVHVPYKSSAQMTTDVMGGQIDVVFHNAPVLIPHVKTGALRALGTTGVTRIAAVPEVPPIAEAGLPGFEVTSWFGLMGPAALPASVVGRINADIVKALAHPDVREKMLAQAAEPVGSTPQEYATFIAAEIVKWARVVKQSGAKVE